MPSASAAFKPEIGPKSGFRALRRGDIHYTARNRAHREAELTTERMDEMKDSASTDPAKPARDALGAAYADLTVASKRGIAEDGKILFGAAAAIDVALEFLLPPNVDRELAAQNCHEALKLVKLTRAYAQRDSGGSAAQALDDAMKKIEDALKVLKLLKLAES
jgi:hypothetical protein